MNPIAFSEPRLRKRGFTLIEMLTVVGIIGILVALMAPALVDIIRATRLNSAGDGLVNRISLAQQSAISLGREVEMRFYKYPDSDVDASGASLFFAYQVVDLQVVANDQGVLEVRPKALSDPYYIESGVIISSLQDLSPMLQSVAEQNQQNGILFTPTIAGVDATQVQFGALRFFPDGSCKVLSQGSPSQEMTENVKAYMIPTLQESFLTIVEARDANLTQPRNFYCIQIDSYTGKTRVYRP
jgi:uncharacterized protein (TIGR02596 family)